MKRTENLVIGAGLMGITTAYELIKRGQSVTVIDQLGAPASSASHANAGMLTPSMPEPWNGPGVYKNLIKSGNSAHYADSIFLQGGIREGWAAAARGEI